MHFILATFFVLGAVFTYLEKPSGPRSRNVFGARVEQVTEDITHWEVVAMSLGIATVNLVLGLSKQRRAARLAIDPDADHPEARVFE